MYRTILTTVLLAALAACSSGTTVDSTPATAPTAPAAPAPSESGEQPTEVVADATTNGDQSAPDDTAAAGDAPANTQATETATDTASSGSDAQSQPPAAADTTAPPATEPAPTTTMAAATTTAAPTTTMAAATTTTTAAPAPVIQVSFAASGVLDVEVDAELVGFRSSNTKGIASVCLVQYNQYGNEIYRDGDPYSASAGSSLEVSGVRYPRLLVEGCRASDDNFGVYTKVWSVDAERGVNGSLKNWYDIAIRAEDGQVRVFCRDMTQARGSFVERRPSDYAGRTSLGPCPG